jgi:putative molybdopterin biosynthesis protein
MRDVLVSNGVRAQRERLGLSQAALAKRVGLSRQALHSVESSRSVPSVRVSLELARALESPVERLFWLPGSGERLHVRAAGAGQPGEPPRRVLLAEVERRVVAHVLDPADATPADGLGTGQGDGAMDVELFPGVRWRERLLLAGCDPALGLLAQRVGAGAHWLDVPSDEAVEMLGRRQVHVAGLHLAGDETGSGNVRAVRRRCPGRKLLLVHFAAWELGFAVKAGNPLQFRDVRSLLLPRLRLINRAPTAAARHLLDRLLRSARISRTRIQGYDSAAPGHETVALTIAVGGADVGITTRAAAVAHGLVFLPLSMERFDLALAAGAVKEGPAQRLLDVLGSSSLRRELGALPGYDARRTGEVVAEVG